MKFPKEFKYVNSLLGFRTTNSSTAWLSCSDEVKMSFAVTIHSMLACAMISDSLNEEHKGLKYIYTQFKPTETHF